MHSLLEVTEYMLHFLFVFVSPATCRRDKTFVSLFRRRRLQR